MAAVRLEHDLIPLLCFLEPSLLVECNPFLKSLQGTACSQ